MNTLSLLIYLSEVIYSLGTFVVIGLTLSWGSYAYYRVMRWVEGDKATPVLPSNKWLWVSGLCLLLLVIIPSKETFYLIVASEAGEAVMKTPEAQDLLSDVKEILNIQLENLKEKKQ